MAQSESEPANSSSGEEEEVSSEGSESESEPDKTSTPPPSSKITKPTQNSSSDDSDEESDSDTDKPPIPDPNSKPPPSNPPDHDKSKKPRSKNPTTRYSPPPLKSSTGKRPAAEGEPSDSKRVKKKTVVAVAAPDADTNGGGGEKKQLFQRLWSEDNEIELIQGMIDYVNEKGKDPVTDVNDFHDFVKKSLHVDVNNKQVVAKVRRLKKKYKNNVARAEKQSKVRSFSNPHEKKMYELSKSLWGNDSNKNVVMSSTTKKVNVKPKQNKNHKSNVNGGVGVEVAPEVTPSEATPIEVEPKMVQPLRSVQGLDHGSMGFVITDEMIMQRGLELLSGSKKVEMQEKWKNLKVQELKHFLKKVELLKEQAEVVLNAMVKSGDN